MSLLVNAPGKQFYSTKVIVEGTCTNAVLERHLEASFYIASGKTLSQEHCIPEKGFVSQARVSGFPEKGADLQGSPGNFRGTSGEVRGTSG